MVLFRLGMNLAFTMRELNREERFEEFTGDLSCGVKPILMFEMSFEGKRLDGSG